MRLATIVLALLLSTFACAMRASAQTLTKQFTYQGYLENNGVPYTGTATVNFGLYSALTGGTLRKNVQISNVSCDKGVFAATVNLGETDSSGAQIYDGTALYLGITVTIGTSTNTLSPRQLVQPAPYALSLPNVTPNGANVGIGTATPASKLDVVGQTRTASLEVTGGVVQKGGTAPATADLGLYSLNNGAWLRLVTNNAPIQFFTSSAAGTAGSPAANSSAMTIAANGLVGVGTTSPANKFHVVDTNAYTARIQSSSTIGAWLELQNTSVGGRDWALVSTGSSNGEGAGKLLIADQTGGGSRMTLTSSGNVGIGTDTPSERLQVNGNIRARVVIIEGGADLAESYDVAAAGETKPTPGMVVSIDPDRVGKLRVASRAYDRAVAGIISGADGVAPGLVLGQKGTVADGAHPIANVGRVWCWVDADAGGAVSPGDLLTTSATPGHAMRVGEGAPCGGAVLGKAMSPLKSGKGMVLVLVSLQ
ncbi:MAG TPA: hypothetical protein PKE29_09710 [Phycisphaerales bacterium]|nr:hypothetical protein [Phycisphaerales bacterium]